MPSSSVWISLAYVSLTVETQLAYMTPVSRNPTRPSPR